MSEKIDKPSHEAKALSLFLMAFKTKNPSYKDKSRRINKLWGLVKSDKLAKSDYMNEVSNMLTAYGGIFRGGRKNGTILHK